MKRAVIDSHALLWALDQPRRLGRRGRRIVEDFERGRASLYIPTVVLLEIGELDHRGRIDLPGGFEQWLQGLLQAAGTVVVDLTVAIVRRAQSFYMIPERGDRLIAATAAELDIPIITRDAEIAKAAGVDVLW